MKQLFDAQEAMGLPTSLAAITGGTSEVNLWTPSIWTPLAPPAHGWQAPARFRLEAGGVLTLPATTPGTTAFTARIGTSSTPGSNTICGAASAAAQGTTQTGVRWDLIVDVTIRALGLPGANSTVQVAGHFCCPLGYQAAGVAGHVLFGGTASVDLSIAQALAISITPSVTGQSFTVEEISWFSRAN